jgi:hypothetical protein
VGNILDVVLIIKSDENLSLVGPPPPSLTKIIFPINYLGGGSHIQVTLSHILVTRLGRVRQM